MTTVLDSLVESLEDAGAYNRQDLVAPKVVLWTDGEGLWSRVIPMLQRSLPQLLVLDSDGTEERRGPSTRLRYLLDRSSDGKPIIIYIPGVARQTFRGAAGFPEVAKHLFALQHLGQFWTQVNGKDWTPVAYLTSGEGGLELEVAKDQATRGALLEQLENVLTSPLALLEGKRLEATDFHGLATSDPIRSMLKWMSDPDAVKQEGSAAEWKSFLGFAKKQFNLDPERDGVLVAADRLIEGPNASWNDAWDRYVEAPRSYPGILSLLRSAGPQGGTFLNLDRRPAHNAAQEDELRKDLLALAGVPFKSARDDLNKLCARHTPRSQSVWAALGEAPLANAALHLGAMADRMIAGTPGHDWQSLAATYQTDNSLVDFSARTAFAEVADSADVAAVAAALRAVYLPWLEALADRVMGLVGSYPNREKESAHTFTPEPGTVLLFVDGLRFDVGMELCDILKGQGCDTNLDTRWAALPTVTATAKPAWEPMASQLTGTAISDGFEPLVATSGRPARTAEFRKLLDQIGWTWLEQGGLGDPQGAAWTEAGAFDSLGHKLGAKLVRQLEGELRAVADRVRDLLRAGWRRVLVITDHGWLWMPGGLPKVNLPAHLTVSKWGRCAVPAPGAQHSFKETPWFWGGEHSVVLAPGVSVFLGGQEYAHGGLSIQEALTPVITVKAGKAGKGEGTKIESVKWVGLRCHVEISGDATSVEVDLRTKAADESSSVLSADQKAKGRGQGGKVSLLVEDEGHAGSAGQVVLIKGGQVIAKYPVTIGGD